MNFIKPGIDFYMQSEIKGHTQFQEFLMQNFNRTMCQRNMAVIPKSVAENKKALFNVSNSLLSEYVSRYVFLRIVHNSS